MFYTPISTGELVDKITILQIKEERIINPTQLTNVKKELSLLTEIAGSILVEVEDLVNQLKWLNTELWEIEDKIRKCEQTQDFGDHFIVLARQVYILNDWRSRVKKQINSLTNSELTEEKSYS